MTAGILLAVGLILGGLGYGLALAMLADGVRRSKRKRAREQWRAMGGGRW